MKNVFVIGSKGIPSNYGGFETFVEKLTEYNNEQEIKYHVSCLSDNNDEFIYNNSRCFNVKVPNIGPAKAIYYDIYAFEASLKYIKDNHLENSIIYVLACRIGPFFKKLVKKAHKLGVKVYVNPDGHEWLRAKWNFAIRKYWKISESQMVKHADLLICDSVTIEEYIHTEYKKYKPNTCYIAYGAEQTMSNYSDNSPEVQSWFSEKEVLFDNYFLIVGRFVPENNYETIIKEFIKSSTNKDLVIITNVEKNSFYTNLVESTKLDMDKRIKFVGTVYDQELLKIIRKNAFGYFHGHEVGGTNPSLLESLAMTNLNMLLDVGFNREVAESTALYWEKEPDSLSNLINEVDDKDEFDELGRKAKKNINERFSWKKITDDYSKVFLNQ